MNFIFNVQKDDFRLFDSRVTHSISHLSCAFGKTSGLSVWVDTGFLYLYINTVLFCVCKMGLAKVCAVPMAIKERLRG